MISLHRFPMVVLAVLVAASSAAAQVTAPTQPQTTPPAQARSVPPGNAWSHATTLNAFGGAAAAARDRAAIGGGAIGWETKPWFALEGSAMWLDWGDDANAFTAAMTAHVMMSTVRP